MIEGETVNDIPASERGLAMVFQSYALYPHMSIYKNMAFGLENSKMPRAEINKRVTTAARMLQLEDYLERKPKACQAGNVNAWPLAAQSCATRGRSCLTSRSPMPSCV